MKKTLMQMVKATLAGAVLVAVLLGPAGPCEALNTSLRVLDASDSEVEGTYTLILFGARFADDVQTIAFLDKDGDRYSFEIYAPDFDYKVLRSVPAGKALERAREFVSWHPDYLRTVLGKILDDKGTVIGYEVRPFYRTTRFASSDVMDILYFQRGDTIRIHVKLKPKVERQLSSGEAGKGGKDR